MEAQESREPPCTEQFRTTWLAFAEQIGDAMSARASADLPQYADMLAIGQESVKLGLQIQLWVFDASTHRPQASVTRISSSLKSASTGGSCASPNAPSPRRLG